ncbi:MAG: hypothetical protein VKJ46_12165 [Leptolyngbyaceae bacterium]|nr:hypothetical protein [Leptolyngbyaceae bacterium]
MRITLDIPDQLIQGSGRNSTDLIREIAIPFGTAKPNALFQ